MKKIIFLSLIFFLMTPSFNNITGKNVHAKVVYSEKKNKSKKRYGENIKLNGEKIKVYNLLVAPQYYNMSVYVDSKNKNFKSMAVNAVKSWNAQSVIQNKTNGNGGKKADLVITRHTNTYSRSGKTVVATAHRRYFKYYEVGGLGFYFPQLRIDTYKSFEKLSTRQKKETLAHEVGHVYGYNHVSVKHNKRDIMIASGFVNKTVPDQDDKKVVKFLKKISYNRYNDYRKVFPKQNFRGTFSFSQALNGSVSYFKNNNDISEETITLCQKKE